MVTSVLLLDRALVYCVCKPADQILSGWQVGVSG